ncbi:MAG TPA: hypothetical protein VN180_03260 [Acidimicrobiia bacterium]|nr:hypothetical protein [Acidimicrobiia bacterium]
MDSTRPPTPPDRFNAALRAMSADDLQRVAASLDSEQICDEVDWWRATIAIDKLLRRTRGSRRAAQAATDAAKAVQEAAGRAGIPLPDSDVTRVARAAADVARGLAAGSPARPVVGLLLEHWDELVTPV